MTKPDIIWYREYLSVCESGIHRVCVSSKAVLQLTMLILTDGPIKRDPQSKAQRGIQTEREREGFGPKRRQSLPRLSPSLHILISVH